MGLSHAYPFKSGYTKVAHLKPYRELTSKPEQRFARLRNGDRLLVDVSDFIGRTIYFLGDYDPKITLLCKRILRPGDTMLDVGANLGVVTGFTAAMVGPRGHVHAFEPQPRLAASLRTSLGKNGRTNVTVHPVALSDRDGELPLYGDASNLATASLTEADGSAQLAVVPVRRSGSYLESLGLPPIRLLKIDVEGHEEAFFSGAEAFFETNPPEAILFESHGAEPFFDRPVVRILGGLGYGFFRIPKARLRLRLHRLTAADPMDASGFDFLAVHNRSPAGLAGTTGVPV